MRVARAAIVSLRARGNAELVQGALEMVFWLARSCGALLFLALSTCILELDQHQYAAAVAYVLSPLIPLSVGIRAARSLAGYAPKAMEVIKPYVLLYLPLVAIVFTYSGLGRSTVIAALMAGAVYAILVPFAEYRLAKSPRRWLWEGAAALCVLSPWLVMSVTTVYLGDLTQNRLGTGAMVPLTALLIVGILRAELRGPLLETATASIDKLLAPLTLAPALIVQGAWLARVIGVMSSILSRRTRNRLIRRDDISSAQRLEEEFSARFKLALLLSLASVFLGLCFPKAWLPAQYVLGLALLVYVQNLTLRYLELPLYSGRVGADEYAGWKSEVYLVSLMLILIMYAVGYAIYVTQHVSLAHLLPSVPAVALTIAMLMRFRRRLNCFAC